MPVFDDVGGQIAKEGDCLETAAVPSATVSDRRGSRDRRVALVAALLCLSAPCRAQHAAGPFAGAASQMAAPAPSGKAAATSAVPTVASPVPAPATAPPANAAPGPAAPLNSDPAGASGAVSLPPPPDAANPTPKHIAQARRLILATGISRSFTVMIAEFMDQIGNTFTQAKPDLVHDMNTVLEQLRPEFDKQSDEMIDQSARIYATLLSEDDIDTILAFYNSQAGRRYVSLQPLFLNQLLSGTQAWQQKIAINMMARVREEMKKKGHDLQ